LLGMRDALFQVGQPIGVVRKQGQGRVRHKEDRSMPSHQGESVIV
jgi:hypothetical protein